MKVIYVFLAGFLLSKSLTRGHFDCIVAILTFE